MLTSEGKEHFTSASFCAVSRHFRKKDPVHIEDMLCIVSFIFSPRVPVLLFESRLTVVALSRYYTGTSQSGSVQHCVSFKLGAMSPDKYLQNTIFLVAYSTFTS